MSALGRKQPASAAKLLSSRSKWFGHELTVHRSDDGTLRNLNDSSSVTRIVFRELPGVPAVERQLSLHARGRLLDDEVEELPYIISDASLDLFGITERDTFYWALPDPVRAQYGRAEWEANFDALGHWSRDPNFQWHAFDLDVCCEEGRSLHCLDVFGRQLICAFRRLHPQAMLAFAVPPDA